MWVQYNVITVEKGENGKTYNTENTTLMMTLRLCGALARDPPVLFPVWS